MKRRAIPFLVAAALVAIGATWWWEMGRPQQQAFEVAEILSGRDLDRVALGTGPVSAVERLWSSARGRSPIGDATDRREWALDALPKLAARYPAAIARAALVERDDETRWTLLDAICRSSAYARLPAPLRVEHVLDHVVLRVDLVGQTIPAAEADVLIEDSAALAQLHRSLRDGHCGAYEMLRKLGRDADPGDIAAALAADAKQATRSAEGCRDYLNGLLRPGRAD